MTEDLLEKYLSDKEQLFLLTFFDIPQFSKHLFVPKCLPAHHIQKTAVDFLSTNSNLSKANYLHTENFTFQFYFLGCDKCRM